MFLTIRRVILGLLCISALVVLARITVFPTAAKIVGGGALERITLTYTGGQSDGASYYPAPSDDGSVVIFGSYGANLTSGSDTNGSQDIFARDTETGSVTRLSVSTDDTPGDLNSQKPSSSADGQQVTFVSAATTLHPADTTNTPDIYLRDRSTNETILVTLGLDGMGANGESDNPHISRDGRYIVYSSIATNLVDEFTYDVSQIYLYDRETGQNSLISINANGNAGNYYSLEPSISDDGNLVVFRSGAENLVPQDTNGEYNIFVYNRTTAEFTLVSVASDGTLGNASSENPSISGDGQWVAFTSYASNMVANDTNEQCSFNPPSPPYFNCADIFLHDLQTGETTLLSVASDGTQGNDKSYEPKISYNGQYVLFQSNADNLVLGDTDPATCPYPGWLYPQGQGNCADVFLLDRANGTLQRLSESLSGDSPNGASTHPYISADGGIVAFTSYASNLVPGDTQECNNPYVNFGNCADGFRYIYDTPPPTFTPTATATQTPTATATASATPTATPEGRSLYLPLVQK